MGTREKFADFSQEIVSEFLSAYYKWSKSGLVIFANPRF